MLHLNKIIDGGTTDTKRVQTQKYSYNFKKSQL